MSNNTKALTDRQVAAFKPKPEAYRESDGHGLFVMVLPTGAKVWRCVYGRAGKRHLLKLGEYPAMSLAEARLARQRVRLDVQDGQHISQERATAKMQRLEAGKRTVQAMLCQWHAANVTEWTAKYAHGMMLQFQAHVFGAIGHRPICAVTRPEVIDLLERCKAKSGAFVANQVRGYLVKAFADWLERELVAGNPADRLNKRTAIPDRKPQPAVLTIEAARAVLAKVEASAAMPMMKLYHRFLALTGLRPSEVREARWSEFDGDVWRVPAERMKGRRGRKRGHVAFLSPQAMEVLEVARALAPVGAVYVFPTQRRRHQPIERSSLCELMTRALGSRVQVAHGWRATMATVLRTLHPEAKDLVQVMLAHQTKETVARLYDRTDEVMFEPKLRPLACEWGALLLAGAPPAWTLASLPVPGATIGGNVVRLRRAA